MDLSGPVGQWVQQWGYMAVFFGIMLENAGVPVPGETIIIVASILAGQGVLRVELIYPTVVLGAIIGDNVGYWVGSAGGRPLLLKLARLWRMDERKLLEAEQRFERHSNMAVFLGRFVALLRIFAGPLAGMLRMPWPRFFLFNATGALLWAAVVVGLAYMFGEHIATVLHHLGLVLLGLVVIFFAWVGYKYWRSKKTAPPEP